MQRKENGRKKEAETQIRRSPQKERETEFFLRFFPRRKTTTERRRRRRRRVPLDIFESSFALCSFSTLSFGCARRGRTIGRQTYFICISLICVIFVWSDYSFGSFFSSFLLLLLGDVWDPCADCCAALFFGLRERKFPGREGSPKKRERRYVSLHIYIHARARAHSFIHKKEER